MVRDGALRFEVKVLLAADFDFAGYAVRAGGNFRGGVTAPDAERPGMKNSQPQSLREWRLQGGRESYSAITRAAPRFADSRVVARTQATGCE